MLISSAEVEKHCLHPVQRYLVLVLRLCVCHMCMAVHWLLMMQALKKWADFGQVAPGVANGQSEVRLDRLEFHRPPNVANQYGSDEGWTGLIQAVIFEVNDRDKIGYSSPQGFRYCCVKELRPKTKCHLDRLIYQVRPASMIT